MSDLELKVLKNHDLWVDEVISKNPQFVYDNPHMYDQYSPLRRNSANEVIFDGLPHNLFSQMPQMTEIKYSYRKSTEQQHHGFIDMRVGLMWPYEHQHPDEFPKKLTPTQLLRLLYIYPYKYH